MRVASCVLVNGDEARNARTALVFAANCVAWAFWRNHQNINVRPRFDEFEVNRQAMSEKESRALFHIGFEVIGIDVRLKFIGCQHHHDISIFGGIGDTHHLETLAFGLGNRPGAITQGDNNILCS